MNPTSSSKHGFISVCILLVLVHALYLTRGCSLYNEAFCIRMVLSDEELTLCVRRPVKMLHWLVSHPRRSVSTWSLCWCHSQNKRSPLFICLQWTCLDFVQCTEVPVTNKQCLKWSIYNVCFGFVCSHVRGIFQFRSFPKRDYWLDRKLVAVSKSMMERNLFCPLIRLVIVQPCKKDMVFIVLYWSK